MTSLSAGDLFDRFCANVGIGGETEADLSSRDSWRDFRDTRMIDAENRRSPEGHAIRKIDKGIE